MRTIRRISHRLNRGKWDAVVKVVRHYAAEKERHLLAFGQDAYFAVCPSDRVRRDALLGEGYRCPNGLQARAWKMALKDAYETLSREWSALASELRPRIAQRSDWSQVQKRYAYWLLKSPPRLAQLMAAKVPTPTHFEVSCTDRKKVQNYLRRIIRRNRGRSPRVKVARSAAFDANMYEVFERDGVQYIKVMSLVPRERIVIPLTGNTPIRGNIRLVLDWEHRRAGIHYTTGVKTTTALTGEPCGLDAGVSEVFTDDEGNRYGEGFGKVLAEASERLTGIGRKRNRLHQIAKKAEARGD